MFVFSISVHKFNPLQIGYSPDILKNCAFLLLIVVRRFDDWAFGRLEFPHDPYELVK